MPYNSYVQHDRLEKYYEKRKTQQRFQRLQKFDEKQKTADAAGGSRFQSLLTKGQDEEAEEYERKLQLSFGGGEPTEVRKKKKKRKRETSDAAAQELEATPDAEDGPTARSRVKKSKKKAGGSDEQTAPAAQEELADKKAAKRNKLSKEEKKRMPDRYTKELREYERKQEEARLERERRQEEEKQRNRKRRESAKGRAITGSLLNQRTAWGQPKMTSMLQMITGKLEREVGSKLKTPEARTVPMRVAARRT